MGISHSRTPLLCCPIDVGIWPARSAERNRDGYTVHSLLSCGACGRCIELQLQLYVHSSKQ